MGDRPRQPELGYLPDFLQFSVRRGIVDEQTALRIELLRRTRGLGQYEFGTALMNDPPDPKLTFENYVVCKDNVFSVELAKTVAGKSPSQLPYNPVYLYGGIGLGKTHLLTAIVNASADKHVLLLNTADLEAEMMRADRLGIRAELREWLVSVEILLLDDIQLCQGREEVQREILSVLNQMTKVHRWMVISSDVPPTSLAGVESLLLSRLGGGVMVNLQMGDKSERRDLIRHFLEDRSVPEDVINYLADTITDNVRRLKAAVAQMLTLGAGTEGGVDLELARAVVPVAEDAPLSDKPVPSVPVNDITTKRPPPFKAVSRADRFKKMLATAESKEEQVLALQIALGERVRELRNEGGDQEAIRQLERALELLRDGSMEEAIKCIST